MNRIAFLVDGFNLYHSLRDASRDLHGARTRWLDLRSLLASYLYVFGAEYTLESIHYFSALPFHREARRPGVTIEHRNYLACLEASEVVVELGRFKPKTIYCVRCGSTSTHYEEKETDVAISVRLFDVLYRDAADVVVLVTGDTDVAPAVRLAAQHFKSKEVSFIFPYLRKNKELAKLVARHFKIRGEAYIRHQLSNPVVLPSGRSIQKPPDW